MKKTKLVTVLLTVVVGLILLGAQANEKNPSIRFPYDKIKSAITAKYPNVTVIGYYGTITDEGGYFPIHASNSIGDNLRFECYLLNTETTPKWLLVLPHQLYQGTSKNVILE